MQRICKKHLQRHSILKRLHLSTQILEELIVLEAIPILRSNIVIIIVSHTQH
jgi:hypothetical protein